MVTRTFLDKTTTIIKDTTCNYGLNPICMLNYGNLTSRIMIHFDVSKLKKLVNDKTYIDLSKIKHTLKMKNCGSINPEKRKQKLVSSDMLGIKERASSFTLIAFKVPNYWDEGIGFDNENDYWIKGDTAISEDGCTWYNSTNEVLWGEEGIFSNDVIRKEYDLFKEKKESIIICEQHFDHGNEDIEMDFTDYVNELIQSEEDNNYGVCISFTPDLEDSDVEYTQYVGFFNNKTNTIYHPVLETTYDSDICDNRMDFYLNKKNKIYLYSFIDGKLENLDYLPICNIEDSISSGITPNVIQEGKGVYCAELKLNSKEYHKDMIIYDTWSNLSYNGEKIDDVELEFVTHSPEKYFSVSNNIIEPKILNPLLVGINDNEKVNQGEQRMIKVFFKIPYSNNDFKLINNTWYRIYVKDGDRELTIVDWDRILKMNHHNFFYIKTDEFIPTEYHVDIKAEFGDEIRIFKNELTFKVISDLTTERF